MNDWNLKAKLDIQTRMLKEYEKVLEELLLCFESAHDHDCLGWECAECEPQIMASKIEKVFEMELLKE